MARRSAVSFQSLLPAQLRERLEEEGPVPLVSPSQANPTVLHSIFSPTFQLDTDNQENVPKTPRPPKTPRSFLRSVTPRNRTVDDTLYLSPVASLLSQPNSFSSSPFSHLPSPYKSLPDISMLSFGNIQSTTCRSSLQAIVRELSANPACPMLLRAAKERLSTLEQQHDSLALSADDEDGGCLLTELSREDVSILSEAPEPLEASTIPVPVIDRPVAVATSRSVEVPSDEDKPVDGRSNNNKCHHHCVMSVSTHAREHQLGQRLQELTLELKTRDEAHSLEQELFWQKLHALQQEKQRLEHRLTELQERTVNEEQAAEDGARRLAEMQHAHEFLRQQLEQEQAAHRRQAQEAAQMEQRLVDEIQQLTKQLAVAQKQQEAVGRSNTALNQLLHESKRNLEDAKQERDMTLQGMLRVLGKKVDDVSQVLHGKFSDAVSLTTPQIRALTSDDRRKLVMELMEHDGASKSALRAMAENLSAAEMDRHKLLKAHNKMETRLRQTNESKASLERDNFALTGHIQELTEQLSATRRYTDQVVKLKSARHEKHWKKRETEYKSVIQGLEARVRNQKAMVPVGLYKSAVAEAENWSAKAAKQEVEMSNLNAKVTSLQAKLRLKDQVAKKSVVARFKPSVRVGMRVGNESQPSVATPSTSIMPIPKLVPENLPEPSQAPLSPSSPPPSVQSKENATPKATPHTSKVTFSVLHAKVASTNRPSPKATPLQARKVSFATPNSADRPSVRAALVQAAGGRKGLMEQLKRMRSPGPA